jgi:transcriptional antiterminator NusG
MYAVYVLVKMLMNDANWHVVRNITGVTGFVGPGSKPVPLTDEEVEMLLGTVRDAEAEVAIGDEVEIIDGIFSGYFGKLAEMNASTGEVTVIVSAVGRDMPIKASVKEIRKKAE